MSTPPSTLRAYDPDRDRPALWRLKRAFETDLAAGDEAKAEAYAAKLDDDYRERYLVWVDDCIAREPECLWLAVTDDAPAGDDGPDGETGTDAWTPVGYAFVLPEAFAHVRDAAVLNELYLGPDHRGSGLADDPLAAAVAHAEEQDLPMDRMVLDVDPDDDRAVAFYRKHGFEPWAEMVARGL